jgi:hypothetical protein
MGLSLRKIALLTKTSERVLILLLYPCLFLFGILLGWDDKIVSQLDKTGWHKFIDLIGTLASCFILLWILQKVFMLIKTKYLS